MDRLRHRLTLARRIQARLAELSDRTSVSEIERDAAIQCFEFSFEAVWKAAQLVLQEREGIVAPSPKSAIRSALQVGILPESDTRMALRMADDRNLTVHTDDEDLAKRIFGDLSGYGALIGRWIDALEHRSLGGPCGMGEM